MPCNAASVPCSAEFDGQCMNGVCCVSPLNLLQYCICDDGWIGSRCERKFGEEDDLELGELDDDDNFTDESWAPLWPSNATTLVSAVSVVAVVACVVTILVFRRNSLQFRRRLSCAALRERTQSCMSGVSHQQQRHVLGCIAGDSTSTFLHHSYVSSNSGNVPRATWRQPVRPPGTCRREGVASTCVDIELTDMTLMNIASNYRSSDDIESPGVGSVCGSDRHLVSAATVPGVHSSRPSTSSSPPPPSSSGSEVNTEIVSYADAVEIAAMTRHHSSR